MKKKARLVSLFLAIAMLASIVPAFAYTKGSLLPQVKTYQTAFADTKGTWCDANVQTVYEVGLMDGKSTTKFDPKGNLTCAQIIVITARLHELLNGGDGKFTAPGAGQSWYQPYLDYLEKLSYTNDDLASVLWYVEDEPYTACDRYDFVWLLSAVLPDSALKAINSITLLPDIYGDTDVLAFYNAGILTGVDAYGTFNGTSSLNRGQAAAMLGRIVDASQRMKFTPKVFSYAKELLGMDAKTPVLTIDGWTVSAETYAYALTTEIQNQEGEALYAYYDTYGQYLDEYYEDDNFYTYESFADFLLAVHGIDVSSEMAVQWNKADKAGLTPASKVTANTLEFLTQVAVLFSHAGDYALTSAQKSKITASLADQRTLFFGFSDDFVAMTMQTSALTENISAKYAPSKSELNSYLNQYNYFYGRALAISYDLGSSDFYGVSKAEALQEMNTIRAAAATHPNDSDYFGYLCWKYADFYYDESTLIPLDSLQSAIQTTVKSMSVGSLSSILCEEDTQTDSGTYYLFLKDDPSGDETVQSTIGSIPAAVQISTWAESAKVVTTSVYSTFSVPALAAKYDALAAAGLACGI